MVAAASGAALFVFMFFDWYGFKVDTGFGVVATASGVDAWQSLSLIDLVLFLVCLVAVGAAALRAADAMPELPWPPGRIVAGAGALAVALVLFRIFVSPVDAGEATDVSRKFGIFLSLIAAGGIAAGGYLAMQERAGGPSPPAPS